MAKYEIKDGVGILPKGTTSIEEAAFRDCKELTSIAIPDSVTEIGWAAFYGCTGLTSIVIPDSVTKIGSLAFRDCTDLTGIVIGKSVTKIEDSAFEGCTGLTSIVIPDSVTEIRGGAFRGCTGLTSIVVSEGNGKYDSHDNCNAIIETESNILISGCNNTVIPDSVTEIRPYAFQGCTGLTSIVIPDSVTEIGGGAFRGCTGLTSIVVSEGNKEYDSRDNCNAIIETNTNKLIVGCSKTVIPDSVTEIEGLAFLGCTGLTSIAIPDSVTEIGFSAFDGCTGLTSIVIGKSVTEIGDEAFAGCTGLTSIVVSEGNKKYDSRDNCNAIIETDSNTLIIVCKNTAIPDSVTEIRPYAFQGCTGLTSIVIPDSVTEIGEEAFMGCTGLTSIVIPDSVTSIGEDAFRDCTGLTSIVIPDSVTEIGGGAFQGCTGLTSIVIPDSVTEIGSFAFRGCTGLTSIVIGKSVTDIGGFAFRGCTGLTSIVVSEGNKEYDSRDNCNAIIYTASNFLINGCNNTVIPDSVTEIGGGAFEGCTGLTSIVIPDSVTEIGGGAFEGCTGLTSIVIPDSVTEIGWNTFEGCAGLTSIVVSEGNKVYDSRNNCNAIIETSSNTLFAGCCKSVIPDSVTEIENYAFKGCTGLTSITIPDWVTEIGPYAFEKCSGLKTAVIKGKSTDFSGMFDDCVSLESVTLPAGIKGLDRTFDGCKSLKVIFVPAKKADYYKKRLPEELHGLIVELPAEKKAKKAKKPAKKVIKGGKVEVTIHGHLEILEYCSQSLINEEESFNDNYYVTYGWNGASILDVSYESGKVSEVIEDISKHFVKEDYFHELFKADGPHPLPVDARWRDEENVEATYIIELADDEEFDINKIEFVKPSDAPEVFEDCFVADHILYDGKEIVTDSLSDYSAEDMFNSPGWEGEIDVI